METDLIFETETSDMLTGGGAENVQIAAASSATAPFDDALPRPMDAAQVVIPEGATVIRIPVAPGELVELPFPADAQFLARIDNGNLAIKVGDVTVILQGYVEDAGQTAPAIEAANGQPLDIAAILASTDPATDIETAAGPSAQGRGADNTGAVFQQLGEVHGFAGFQAAGTQDGTDGLGGGTVDQTGTLFVQFGEAASAASNVVVNVPPTFQGGITRMAASENVTKISVPLGWVIADPDDAGHTITLNPIMLPAGVTYDSKTEAVEFDLAGKYDYLKATDSLNYILTFTITDDRGASTEKDLPVSILGSNDAPVAVRDLVVVDADATSAMLPLWALAVNDKDVEGEALHVSKLKDLSWDGNETVIAFIPPGDSVMSYAVSDGAEESSEKNVTYHHDSSANGVIAGTASREILVGTNSKEALHGGGGDDIIAGNGGDDEIFGGGGDDTLVFSAGSGIHGQKDRVALSGGLEEADKHGDILAFGDEKLDFSDHASVADLDGIETISMQAKFGGFTAQSLTIGAESVQDLSDHKITPGGVFPKHEAIRIDGDAVDQLYLSISKDGGSWTDTGVVTNGYAVYAHETAGGDPATTDAYVMVSAAIPGGNVHLNQDQP